MVICPKGGWRGAALCLHSQVLYLYNKYLVFNSRKAGVIPMTFPSDWDDTTSDDILMETKIRNK